MFEPQLSEMLPQGGKKIPFFSSVELYYQKKYSNIYYILTFVSKNLWK